MPSVMIILHATSISALLHCRFADSDKDRAYATMRTIQSRRSCPLSLEMYGRSRPRGRGTIFADTGLSAATKLAAADLPR
ncbi:hypothetical protein B0H12DRAFT_1102130 [Mycena haematopus]|nr:hypothetical protein B0H12DRAFT_1102130 [Mycena haematopus]